MELGISTYTYTWAIGVPGYPELKNPMSAVDLLHKAKEHGMKVVQFCDNLPLHLLSSQELDEVKSTAEELGLELEVGTRGVEPQHLLRYLEIAHFLNSKLLRIILQKNNAYVHIDEAYELIKEVLQEFEKKGIALAIENHERHKVEELAHLVKRLDSPYAGICLDTVNSFGALEGPRYVIETLAPYTINLHFKDFEIKRLSHNMGFEVNGTPAGSGMLDIEFVLQELRKYGKEFNVILELWTPYNGDVEETIAKEAQWADKSIKFLKEYRWEK